MLRQEVRFFAPALSTKTKLRDRNKLNFLVCLVRRKWSTGPQDSEPWFSVSHRQPCWTAGPDRDPLLPKCYFDFKITRRPLSKGEGPHVAVRPYVWTPLFCKHMEPLEQRFACSAVLGLRLCGVLKLPQSTSLPAIQTFFFFILVSRRQPLQKGTPVTTSNSSQGERQYWSSRDSSLPASFSTNLMLWHLRFDARRKKQLPIDSQVTTDDRRRTQSVDWHRATAPVWKT